LRKLLGGQPHPPLDISFEQPDVVREFSNGRAEILKVGAAEIGRSVLEPGWHTESCAEPHFQYHVSGRLAIRMDDGEQFVAKRGDVTSLPSGHDAWVVGDEPVVVVDWFGASKTRSGRRGTDRVGRGVRCGPADRYLNRAISSSRRRVT
jgi:quercetin dioxygenase-like cupin family protein